MLTFAQQSDFLLVDSFTQTEPDLVRWIYQDGDTYHNGVIEKLETRTRTVQDGTEEVLVGTEQVQTGTETVVIGTEQIEIGTEEVSVGFDAEGVETFDTQPIYADQDITEEVPIFTEQDVFETQPKYITESYSPWDEMVAADLAGDISVTWLDEAVYTAEQDAVSNLQQFKSTRQNLVDTAVVDANGFLFDANEVAIGRMANAILALMTYPDTYALQWSLADTPTGVMTTVNLHDLKLAHQLAVANMSAVWGV